MENKIVFLKFKKNDLINNSGKQFEFPKSIYNDFFGLKLKTETLKFIYNDCGINPSLDNETIEIVLEKSEQRTDYKIYSSGEGHSILKKFLLEKLCLSEENINDYYALKKIDEKKYNFYYFPKNATLDIITSKLTIDKEEIKFLIDNKLDKDFNRIIFGAPGTGKSYQLDQDRKKYFDESHFERVTFHPNYSYAQFVGTYKPEMKKNNSSVFDSDKKWILEILTDKNKTAQEKYDTLFDKFKDDSLTRLPILLGLYTDNDFKTRKQDGTPAANDNSVERNHGKAIRPYVSLYNDASSSEEITYEYTPGPFIRILEKALKSMQDNTNENFLLIIEEINRANVAAVFGDVFQLLDRNSDNESEYKIAASEDLKKYLVSKGIDEETAANLYIPSNMYIWATMNSADQGVQPLDTAFKRRWDFEYLPINGDEKSTVDNKPLEDYLNEAFIPFPPMKDNKYQLESWNVIRKAINLKLKNIGINEDKLLGPFFISKSRLDEVKKIKDEPTNEGNALFVAHFKSKVLMYLFEDAAKMHHSSIFDESNGKKHFSDICADFDTRGIEVFSSDIVNEIRNGSKTSQGE